MLSENLHCFDDEEIIQIFDFLSQLPDIKDKENVLEFRRRFIENYGEKLQIKNLDNSIICSTKHLLSSYLKAYESFQSSLSKFSVGNYRRNILDDMRLSLELLIKDIFSNDKSLENQSSILGVFEN